MNICNKLSQMSPAQAFGTRGYDPSSINLVLDFLSQGQHIYIFLLDRCDSSVEGEEAFPAIHSTLL